MKEIKIELIIEKSCEGVCNLEELLEWLGMTEEKWNALTKEQQESLMYDYYEDVVDDADRNGCYDMDYRIKITE